MDKRVRTALLSVSDKTGLVEFAQFLALRGVNLLSTGGTAQALREAGLKVTNISEYTGFPEILDGRLKTLHPLVHGGLLGKRDNAAHKEAMEKYNISPIDMVVINLYPFEQTVSSGAEFAECIEQIDIGGPSMIRSAAKNHPDVVVLCDPADYNRVQEEMARLNGGTELVLRTQLAAKAFALTATYDSAIANWFAQRDGEDFPVTLTFAAPLKQKLRYGENPHQQAAFYARRDAGPGIATARQVQGKELSYNNINDTDAAFALVAEFKEPAVAIIKHANPCGVAVGKDMHEAYLKALACDRTSAYGGIVALNRTLDTQTAKEIAKLFVEVIIAPDAEQQAIESLAGKKNLRLLLTGGLPVEREGEIIIKSVSGGYLLQHQDSTRVGEQDVQVVTKRTPTIQQMKDLLFAFSVCKHVKSNAIVLANETAIIGIGAGQMSRIDSARIASEKARAAGFSTQGSVLASDAFFPFPDTVLEAARIGISAIIQPGGSIRDREIIDTADEHNLAMVFTGIRHFKH